MLIWHENVIGPDSRVRKAGVPAEFGIGRRKDDAEAAAASEAVANAEAADGAADAEPQETTA